MVYSSRSTLPPLTQYTLLEPPSTHIDMLIPPKPHSDSPVCTTLCQPRMVPLAPPENVNPQRLFHNKQCRPDSLDGHFIEPLLLREIDEASR